MSKNFELLQRVAKSDYFCLPGDPAQLSQKPACPIPFRKDPTDAEIAKLVQRLFSPSDGDSSPKAVSFSGIARDDRSSWICAWAGEALAEQTDACVCIVDANLWSPQSHIHSAGANSIGLAEALASRAPIRKFARPLRPMNLWLMPAGLAKPGLYFPMKRCRERFNELREEFGYLLISAPSLDREMEATLIGQLADGVVLIVEANHSRRETVRRAKEQLECARVRLLGAVLDQRTFPIPEKLYRRL